MKTWPLLIAALLVSPAFAQDKSAPADTQAAAQAATPTQAVDERANGMPDRMCLRDTGSHITTARNYRERRTVRDPAARKLTCASTSGRSYSREDIERTGAGNLRDALWMLDPSMR